jgi:tetratricopeptide (TPR) repeat protein
MNYNQVKAIHHGKVLLKAHAAALKDGEKPLQKSTLYNVHSYLAEAYCMLGRFTQALEQLEKAEGVFLEHDPQREKALIEKVEHRFRELNVISSSADEKA